MSVKPSSVTVGPWLKANLGKKCLAGCTGTDWKALLAAVQIIELYSYERNPAILTAFGAIVQMMQPKQYFLAFHAIAHVMDWSDRASVWGRAGLPLDLRVPACQFEPAARVMPDAEAA